MNIHLLLLAASILFAASVRVAPAEATPLYMARAGRTCDNCHSLPNTWYNPADTTLRKCTLSCASCHVDPSGGGLRNVSGRYYQMTTLTLFLPSDRPLVDRKRDLFPDTEAWLANGSEPSSEPSSEPTSGKAEPLDHQADPRPPGSPEPNGGPAFGRPFGEPAEMAWLDGRYADLNADPLLQFGGDLRLAWWTAGPFVFPMQAELDAAVHPVEHLTLATSVGLRGRTRGQDAVTAQNAPIGVRDLWVSTHEWPMLSCARVGRFLPGFGTRISDHTAYIRRAFGFSQEDPGNRVIGAEVGFTGNYPYMNASAFVPSASDSLNPFETRGGWGAVVSAGYRELGWSLGASGRIQRKPLAEGGDTLDGSLQWTFNPWFYLDNLPLTYLGELAVGTLQRPYSGNETKQIAVMQLLAWTVAPGILVEGHFDYWDPDDEVIDDEIMRPGLSVELTLLPGLALRSDMRIGLIAGGEAEEAADALLHLHGWF